MVAVSSTPPSSAGYVEYFPESVRGYSSRRLAVGIALIFVWLFVGLIAAWIWRSITGRYANLTVPPYGSGTIHLMLCLCVVLVYVVGTVVIPRRAIVGLREGALPSLVCTPNEKVS